MKVSYYALFYRKTLKGIRNLDMKKLLMLILSLSMATVAFASCDMFMTSSSVESTVSTPASSEEAETKEYSVVFLQAGQEDVVVVVEQGGSVAEADIPEPVQVEGYTTVWNAEDLAKLTNVTTNLTVNTVATANKYTITFEAGAGVDFPETQEVTYDASFTLETPVRAGYTFGGWFVKGTETVITDGTWKTANDVTLVAKWTKTASDIVAVTFDYGNGQTVMKTVVKGGTLTDIPAFPTDAGYDYAWSVTDFTAIENHMTVKLIATAKVFEITYDANGGTFASGTSNKQYVTYGEAYALANPTVTKEGLEFAGWEYREGTLPTGTWNLVTNVTLYAKWVEPAPEMVTVTFNYGNGQTVVKTVVKGSALTDIPAFPTDAGYDYAWSVTDFTAIGSDMTVNLIATAKTYTVTYDANGGTFAAGAVTSETVTFGSEYALTYPTVSYVGYNFAGWIAVEGSMPVGDVWNVASNVTLQAKWDAKGTASVTFVYANGETATSASIYVGDSLTAIPNPTDKTVTGYTVDTNWYTDSACTTVASFENITASMTVYAKKTAKTYTVTYIDGGESKTATATYDAKFSLGDLEKEGYLFMGWRDNDGNLILAADQEITWKYDCDMTLTALWMLEEGEWTKNY